MESQQVGTSQVVDASEFSEAPFEQEKPHRVEPFKKSTSISFLMFRLTYRWKWAELAFLSASYYS